MFNDNALIWIMIENIMAQNYAHLCERNKTNIRTGR